MLFRRDKSTYKKQQNIQPRGLSKIKNEVKNISTNVVFNARQKVNTFKNYFQFHKNQNKIIYILGSKITTQKQLQQQMQSIIWFTYRRLSGISTQTNNDTGWGCLIRVGQMALASALRKYLSHTCKGIQSNTIRSSVITAFLQKGGKQQKYSLIKIIQNTKNKKIGDWFNVLQICNTLTDLHTKNPMKSTQNLSIITFQSATIYLEQVLTKMDKKICQCQKKRLSCNKCQSTQKAGNPKKQLLMFVCCQLGYEHIQQKQYKQLIKLMTLQQSLGIIGGTPKRGLYFFGYQGQQLLNLDPHYVQDQVILKTYTSHARSFTYSSQRHKCDRNNLDPSLSFVFYIEDIPSLSLFTDQLKKALEQQKNPIISIQWVNQYKKNKVITIQQQQFQNGNDGQLNNSFIDQ